MAELTRISVAAEIGAADPAAEAPGVTVRLIDPGALWLVSDNLPDLAPNALRGGAPYWLWLAPDRALRVGAGERPGGFASDVTDGFATFEIAGARAAEIIAMGCTLDPYGETLAPGRCAQTLFAGVRAVLYAHDTPETFRLHAERPLASYLHEWFIEAARALRQGTPAS
jgi:heterotetrameric sarcosine oxidase gamma subunit